MREKIMPETFYEYFLFVFFYVKSVSCGNDVIANDNLLFNVPFFLLLNNNAAS